MEVPSPRRSKRRRVLPWSLVRVYFKSRAELIEKLAAGLRELLLYRKTKVAREPGLTIAFLAEARADLESLQVDSNYTAEAIQEKVLFQPHHSISLPRLPLPLYWVPLNLGPEPVLVFFTPHLVVVRILVQTNRSPKSYENTKYRSPGRAVRNVVQQ